MRPIVRLIVTAALGAWLAGCVYTRNGFEARFEPAPMYGDARGDGVRESHVRLQDLLVSELAQHGVAIRFQGYRGSRDESTYPPLSTGAADTRRIVWISGRSDAEVLDQLVASVDETSNPVAVRNDVAAALIDASVRNCNVYLQSLRGGQVGARLATDLFSATFAGASSLIQPESTAQILAALAGLSTTTGASVDRNVFAQQGAELVADAIDQLRAERRGMIEQRLTEGYSTYPMGLALADLSEFHGDCSMLRGFARLREVVIAREQTVDAIRAAAVAVQQSGGSGSEVVAALAGLSPDGHRIRPIGGGILSTDVRADLGRLETAARACFETAAGLVSASHATAWASLKEQSADFQAGGACATGTEWNRVLLPLVDRAAEGLSEQAVRGDTAPSDSDTAAALAELNRDLRARMDAIARARELAVHYLANWNETNSADRIGETLSALAGLTVFSSEPPGRSDSSTPAVDTPQPPGVETEESSTADPASGTTPQTPAQASPASTAVRDPFFLVAIAAARAVQDGEAARILRDQNEDTYSAFVAAQALEAANAYMRRSRSAP